MAKERSQASLEIAPSDSPPSTMATLTVPTSARSRRRSPSAPPEPLPASLVEDAASLPQPMLTPQDSGIGISGMLKERCMSGLSWADSVLSISRSQASLTSRPEISPTDLESEGTEAMAAAVEFKLEVECEPIDFRMQSDIVPVSLRLEQFDAEEVKDFVVQQFLIHFNHRAGLRAGWQDQAGMVLSVSPHAPGLLSPDGTAMFLPISSSDVLFPQGGFELVEFDASASGPSYPRRRGQTLMGFASSGGEFRVSFHDPKRNIEVVPLNCDGLRARKSATTHHQPVRHRARPISNLENWWQGKAFSKTTFFSYHFFQVYVAYLLFFMAINAFIIWRLEAGRVVEDEKHPDGPRKRILDFSDALYLSMSVASGFGNGSWKFSETLFTTQLVVVVHTMLCSYLLLTTVPLVLRRRSFRFQMRHEMRKGSVIGHAVETGDLEIVEYNALGKLLSYILGYYIFVQLIGFLIIWPLQACRGGPAGGLLGAFWPSLVLVIMAFHNTGLTLVDLPFKKSSEDPDWVRTCMLPVVCLLVLMGNTCYPLALRYILRIHHLRCERLDPAIKLLLKDPRRCYTHLFPGYATRWLLMVTVLLFLFQVCAMYIAESEDYKMKYAGHQTFWFMIFHTVTSRSAGIALCNLSKLDPAAVFVVCVCMYISVSPVVVATRSTQVSTAEPEYDIEGAHIRVAEDFTQKRAQLAKFMGDNAVILVILFFLILHAEQVAAEKHFIWVVFEFCSAWGTCGLTMSPSGYAYSGEWSFAGKILIMVVMFMGRLRGLPYAIDPSVRLRYQPPKRNRLRPSRTSQGGITWSRQTTPACATPIVPRPCGQGGPPGITLGTVSPSIGSPDISATPGTCGRSMS